MARKKAVTEDPVIEEGVEVVEEVIENETVAEEEAEVDVVERECVVTKDEETVSEIPEYALSILKIYSNCEYLRVSPKGGAYDSDTQPPTEMGAILYKNPYYNS